MDELVEGFQTVDILQRPPPPVKKKRPASHSKAVINSIYMRQWRTTIQNDSISQGLMFIQAYTTNPINTI